MKDYKIGENITLSSAYPAGALLQDKKSGAVYFVQNGQKQGIIDRTIMAVNFKKRKPTVVTADELAKYPDAGPLKLADGTLVTGIATRAVYVVADGIRRPIVSADAFEKLGYRWSDIVTVPEKVLELHSLGKPLDVVLVDDGSEVLGDNIVK